MEKQLYNNSYNIVGAVSYSSTFQSQKQQFIIMVYSAQAIGIVGCLSCVVPHVANNFFKGHLPKLLSTF